jgi:hypothetical protein
MVSDEEKKLHLKAHKERFRDERMARDEKYITAIKIK